ncbi:MAG: uroporphyrinogen decarboxylase family protein, partial [Caldilinea sp.]
ELDYKIDMPVVKAATHGRTTVLGPVDPSGVMALGTPQDVEDAACEAIAILGEGGGLILGPGCALPPKTPPENVHALIETARKHGVYA